jgi:glycosyltransferase involved in cell wall biosynthesis
LQDLARDLGIADRVLFKGWINFENIPAWIKNSRVCVIPHVKNEHTESTMPNKIYDYMYFGKPVAVSDIKPLVRIVTEARAGLVFKSGDYRDLGEELIKLLSGSSAGVAYGQGKELIETKYNWGVDSAKLVGLIASYER